MGDPMLTIGYAAIGAIAAFGAFEVYDAYRYRHHPNESVAREVKTWGIVLLVWILAVGLVEVLG